MTLKNKIEEKIGEKKLFSASMRCKFTLELYRYLRPFPTYQQFLRKGINIHNLFDASELLINKLMQFGDIEKGNEWIKYANEDLQASKRLRDTEYALSLYHLQQSVEKLLKGTVISFGLFSEDVIAGYKHRPQKFLIDLLENPVLNEIIEKKYPFIGVWKPGKITGEDIKKIREIVAVDKAESIKRCQKEIGAIADMVDNPLSPLFEIKILKSTAKTNYDKIIPNLKERENFKERLQKDHIDIEEIFDFWGDYTWLIFNLFIFLISLSSYLWAFESITRYPDEGRKLGLKFNEFEIYRHQKPLLYHLEKYIEVYNDMFT